MENREESANHVGPDGVLRVDGAEIYLRHLDEWELNQLHGQWALEADLIRNQLADADLEQQASGTLSYERLEWRKRARHALALKKKQMNAIHIEFARRKSLTQPLSDFAFSAVCAVLGEEVLQQVEAEARKQQERHHTESQRLGVAADRRFGSRQQVCGSKIRHADKESANQQIEQMLAEGLHGEDLVIYPCPYCGFIHVGNDRKRRARRRYRHNVAARRRNDGSATLSH